MTQTEALSELRAMLNEASAGFYTDAELYKFLSSGQVEVVTQAYSKQVAMKKIDPAYQSEVLRPIEDEETKPIGEGETETTLPDLFLFSLSLIVRIGGIDATATKMSYSEVSRREENSFTQASQKNPVYYIRGQVVGVRPATVDMEIIHSFLKTPTAITDAGDFTLGEESRKGILWYAYSYALSKNQRFQEALQARQIAINLTKDL